MISLISGIQKVILMNFFTKQKQTHRHGEQIAAAQGEAVGEGRTGNLGLADANWYTEKG